MNPLTIGLLRFLASSARKGGDSFCYFRGCDRLRRTAKVNMFPCLSGGAIGAAVVGDAAGLDSDSGPRLQLSVFLWRADISD